MAISSRQLILSVPLLRPHSKIHPLLPLCAYHRTLFDSFFKPRRKKPTAIDIKSPEFQKKVEDARGKPVNPDDAAKGDLARSIFDEKLPRPPKRKDTAATLPSLEEPEPDYAPVPKNYLKTLVPTAGDPQPRARVRWQRKKVIQSIRKNGQLTKAERILRTERSHLSKSPFIKTSVKKLGPLARQIAGKPLTEAMIQMRFSKKRAAQDMLKHLQYARNEAVVVKGMGLGKVNSKGEEQEEEEEGEDEAEEQGKETGAERLVVKDKDGKKRVITDRSAMYVDEAWVGRGTPDHATDFRAMGKSARMDMPFTSVSVVLKEETTRIRLAEEREQKRQRRKVWVPLADRPITAQRQYPLW